MVYMQMLANFRPRLPIYNRATWKPIHPSAPLLPEMVAGFEGKYSANVEPSATETQSNLKNLLRMHKYNQ